MTRPKPPFVVELDEVTASAALSEFAANESYRDALDRDQGNALDTAWMRYHTGDYEYDFGPDSVAACIRVVPPRRRR